jgi:ATP-binding protein involved in chromosome partitioning
MPDPPDSLHMVDSSQYEQQQEELLLEARMADIRRKLLVLSGKGGVGKSTVAANLAAALARAGKRVGLLDVDIHGPSIPKLMGLETHAVEMAGDQILPVRLGENLAVMSIGFLLPSGSDPVIWRGPMKHGAIRQFLKDVAWGKLDYLVVDSPPGTGDEPLSVAQLIGPSSGGAVVVTTPQDVAVADVRRCVTFCRTLSLPVVGIVENMSGLVCPHCGQQIDLFKRGGGAALAAEMGVPFLGRIPIEPEIVTAGDEGRPPAAQQADSPAAAAFSEVVNSILASEESA